MNIVNIDNMKKTSIQIDKQLKKRLSIIAINKNINKNQLLLEYIIDGFKIDKEFETLSKLIPQTNIKTPKTKEKITMTYKSIIEIQKKLGKIAINQDTTKTQLITKYIQKGILKDQKYLTSHLTDKEIYIKHIIKWKKY